MCLLYTWIHVRGRPSTLAKRAYMAMEWTSVGTVCRLTMPSCHFAISVLTTLCGCAPYVGHLSRNRK